MLEFDQITKLKKCTSTTKVHENKFLSYYVYGSGVVQGAVSIRKTVLPGMAIPMLKIRRPNGRLIFNMEIAIRR